MRGALKVPLLSIVLLACICASTQVVRGDGTFVIVETEMLNPTQGNFIDEIVSIPQFDPANGTLCFVVVRITANYDAMILAENKSPNNGGHISVMATQTLTVTPPMFVAPLPIPNSELIPFTSKPVAPFDGTVDFMGPSSATFTYTPDNPRDVQLANLIREPADSGFGNFIGLGTYDFSFDGSGTSLVYSNTGGFTSQSNMFIGAKVEVEYHFIPEPATLALLLPGMLLIRRRRPRI